MTRTLEYLIEETAADMTAEQYLKIGCSRNVLSRLKAAPDGIQVDGTAVFASRRLSPGEHPTRIFRRIRPLKSWIPFSWTWILSMKMRTCW